MLKTPEALEVTPERLEQLSPRELSDHLERGGLVMLPQAPMALPSDEDIQFLRDETPKHHTHKNISYYPLAGRISGMGGPPSLRERTGRILKAHHERVESFLKRVIPTLAPGWTTGTSSLRVFQEKDRNISVHARSDLLHLDARAYGCTRGDLILRFLTNLDDEDRVWKVKGTVADLVAQYGSAAGLQRGNLLKEGLHDRLYSSLVRGLAIAFPMARSLDQSAYDRAMGRMHNYMKESDEFQQDPEGACEVHFRPRSCWLVFADMAGHACRWGRFCIIDTFIVPKENFRDRWRTPYEVLRRYERGEECELEERASIA